MIDNIDEDLLDFYKLSLDTNKFVKLNYIRQCYGQYRHVLVALFNYLIDTVPNTLLLKHKVEPLAFLQKLFVVNIDLFDNCCIACYASYDKDFYELYLDILLNLEDVNCAQYDENDDEELDCDYAKQDIFAVRAYEIVKEAKNDFNKCVFEDLRILEQLYYSMYNDIFIILRFYKLRDDIPNFIIDLLTDSKFCISDSTSEYRRYIIHGNSSKITYLERYFYLVYYTTTSVFNPTESITKIDSIRSYIRAKRSNLGKFLTKLNKAYKNYCNTNSIEIGTILHIEVINEIIIPFVLELTSIYDNRINKLNDYIVQEYDINVKCFIEERTD